MNLLPHMGVRGITCGNRLLTNTLQMTIVTRGRFQLVLLCCILNGMACNGTRDIKNDPQTPSHITFVDATGTRVSLTRRAERVISLAPNLTESMCAIGAQDLLVGRTSYCDYPPSVDTVPVVGNLQTVDYEKVVSLKPDIVLMTFAGNSEGTYRKLQQLGVTPFAFDASSIDGVVNMLDTIGALIGRAPRAHAVSDSLRRRLDRVRTEARKHPAVPTFLVVNRVPLMTVSRGYLSEALELAGGTNVARGSGIVYPTYSREELIRQDPEVIIVPGATRAAIDALLTNYPEWGRLRAVRDGKIRLVAPDPLMRPGPRLVRAIEELFERLHSNP